MADIKNIDVYQTVTSVSFQVEPNTNVVNINKVTVEDGGLQNLQSVTNIGASTTNSITASSFVKSGGSPTQFLMSDGSVTIGNGGVYSYEIHVSQVDGNDTTGTGSVLNPVATITKALTLVSGLRKTIVIHPGNYTENPNITVQYTVLTTYAQLGGNTALSGTITVSTGCTISGLKMTALTINGVTGTGNVNILNCDISGTFTKSGSSDYTLIRFCDIGALNIISTAGLVAIFGGNPNFITVNNAGARIIVKNAITVAPVLTAGTLTFADCVIIATTSTSNAITTAPNTIITLANSQVIIPTFQNVARVSLSGFYSILNCVYDRTNSFLISPSATGGSTNSIVYSQFINADKFIKQGGLSTEFLMADGSVSTGLATTTYVDNQDALKVDKVVGERLINASEITKLSNQSGTNTGDNATNTQYSGLATSKYDASNPSGYQTAAQVQTIADAKVVQTITNGVTATAPSQDAVFDALALKANDSAVVHATGAETIAGAKTFSTAPILTSLTASQLLALDASKNIQTLTTATYPSLTELAFVKGATSSLQTQLNQLPLPIEAQLTYLDMDYTIFDAFYLRVIADSGTIESTSQLLSTLANLRSISYIAQGYTQQLNADKFVKLGGTAEKYLMANGSALSNIATNATTTALSLATLNSTYPTAIIGFRVQCINITAGKLIYEKTSTGYVSYSITVIT